MSTCSGRNIWWTLQWPFQRITLLLWQLLFGVAAERVGVRIPERHFVERMPMPMAVLRPRC